MFLRRNVGPHSGTSIGQNGYSSSILDITRGQRWLFLWGIVYFGPFLDPQKRENSVRPTWNAVEYTEVSLQARTESIGWADTNFQMPWNFVESRHTDRQKYMYKGVQEVNWFLWEETFHLQLRPTATEISCQSFLNIHRLVLNSSCVLLHEYKNKLLGQTWAECRTMEPTRAVGTQQRITDLCLYFSKTVRVLCTKWKLTENVASVR
jgi:hypothetical protein